MLAVPGVSRVGSDVPRAKSDRVRVENALCRSIRVPLMAPPTCGRSFGEPHALCGDLLHVAGSRVIARRIGDFRLRLVPLAAICRLWCTKGQEKGKFLRNVSTQIASIEFWRRKGIRSRPVSGPCRRNDENSRVKVQNVLGDSSATSPLTEPSGRSRQNPEDREVSVHDDEAALHEVISIGFYVDVQIDTPETLYVDVTLLICCPRLTSGISFDRLRITTRT